MACQLNVHLIGTTGLVPPKKPKKNNIYIKQQQQTNNKQQSLPASGILINVDLHVFLECNFNFSRYIPHRMVYMLH